MAADEDRRVETRGQPPRTSEAFDEQEPALEEILSSIRNIVSAGGAAGEPLTPDPASDEDGARTPAPTERRDRSGETADEPPGERSGAAPDEMEALTAQLDRDEGGEAPGDAGDPGVAPDAIEALTAQLDRDEDDEPPEDAGDAGAAPDAMEALTAQLDRDEDDEASGDAGESGAEPDAMEALTAQLDRDEDDETSGDTEDPDVASGGSEAATAAAGESEAAPAEHPESAERSDPPVTATAEEPDMTSEAPSAPVEPASEAPQQSAAQSHTPLISPAAEAASVGALAALIAEERRTDADGASPAGDGRTVEQVAEDLLRPMLREWLDDNLPSLVARIVEAEVRRLSARLGR